MSFEGVSRYKPQPDWTDEDYRRAMNEMLADIEQTSRQTKGLYALSIVVAITLIIGVLIGYL